MSRVEVIVAVDAKNEQEFHALASTAESVGLQIHPTGRMVGVGVLAGAIDAAAIGRLKSLPGVLSVETSRTFQLPPKDREPQ